VSQTSHDARAVVRAIDALTTQVQRLADYRQTDFALTPDAADDAPTTPDDGSTERCEHDGPHPGFTCGEADQTRLFWEAQWARDSERARQHAPAADEDAQRTTRRQSLRNLIDRLDRNGALAYDEGALLRQHVEAEIRESDQWRAGRNTMKRRGEEIERDRDRIAAELEQAQAAIERVRAVPESWEQMPADRHVYIHEAARVVRAALDGTEQSTTEA
jgi:hypothetical protein